MTTPPEPAPSNPPNPQPAHAQTQPENPPVQRPAVVVPPVDNSGLTSRVDEMARTLAGLPEQIVNGFREATQPAQPPASQTQQSTSPAPGASAPAPPASVEQQTTGGTGAKRGKFADWWFRR